MDENPTAKAPLTNKPSREQQQLLIARLSLWFGVAILLLKFYAFRLTDSQAILSDALESVVNVVAAIILVSTLKYAAKPADQDHPYGHGKMEFFSAAFEGGLISFAALYIMLEAGAALLYGHQLHALGQGSAFVIGATGLNALLGWYMIHRGKELNSTAMQASGQHLLSDVWTSVAIVVGLLAVYLTGWIWLDSLLALFAGGLLARAGFNIVRQAASGLMDAEDPEVLKAVAQSLEPHMGKGIIEVHELKIMRAGPYHHIDLHVVLPEFWTIEQAHNRLQQFEQATINDYKFDGEMHFYYDPCQRAYCVRCDLAECNLRNEAFAGQQARSGIIWQSQSSQTLDS